MKVSFEDLAMQKWNIQTDRAQTVDEKNGVIYWIIMFTGRVMVIKMSKIAADGSEKLITDFIELFQKMVWLIGFGDIVHGILRVKL